MRTPHLRLQGANFVKFDRQRLRNSLCRKHLVDLSLFRDQRASCRCRLRLHGIEKRLYGGTYAKRLRSRAPRPGDRWHLDEVYLSINGKLQYLSRAVDQDGEVLDILAQRRRNRKAAKKFFRKLLRRLQYVPRAIITDKLGSYAAAKAELLPNVQYIQDKRANNRAENSHQPTRERERRMRGFKSAGHAQRFLATLGVIASFFCPGRHLLGSRNYREVMRRRFTQWSVVIHPSFAGC